jgi:hypothetical protein
MDVVTEIVIERPPDVVAAYAANPDNVPRRANRKDLALLKQQVESGPT